MKEILSQLKDSPAEKTLQDDLVKLRKKGLINFKGQTRNEIWFLKEKSE